MKFSFFKILSVFLFLFFLISCPIELRTTTTTTTTIGSVTTVTNASTTTTINTDTTTTTLSNTTTTTLPEFVVVESNSITFNIRTDTSVTDLYFYGDRDILSTIPDGLISNESGPDKGRTFCKMTKTDYGTKNVFSITIPANKTLSDDWATTKPGAWLFHVCKIISTTWTGIERIYPTNKIANDYVFDDNGEIWQIKVNFNNPDFKFDTPITTTTTTTIIATTTTIFSTTTTNYSTTTSLPVESTTTTTTLYNGTTTTTTLPVESSTTTTNYPTTTTTSTTTTTLPSDNGSTTFYTAYFKIIADINVNVSLDPISGIGTKEYTVNGQLSGTASLNLAIATNNLTLTTSYTYSMSNYCNSSGFVITSGSLAYSYSATGGSISGTVTYTYNGNTGTVSFNNCTVSSAGSITGTFSLTYDGVTNNYSYTTGLKI
ncbi:MAG: hypothetical protein A2086_00210 [Spirochaetes bacterium GWD1_27_9]|nr:MAG: hypothetical protein A2Z98_04145 [Spirochaetes bacterium GWB1_27_13]OHD20014.1 MAG: hypothetical protein A2Y34_08160 [Spirochaetes bacterium GWC1_27_15]OHD30495.1 MAG: hypothetical protein A2086_00210 [Spirochaetes bacterium GWD1_27_9]